MISDIENMFQYIPGEKLCVFYNFEPIVKNQRAFDLGWLIYINPNKPVERIVTG